MGKASSSLPIKLFISYAHRDEDFRLELNDQLSNLQRQKIISSWHDRQIVPGQEWAGEIDDALNEARIILLLISARFMASDYCYSKEMLRAIERHDAGEAVVIPIILSACDWQDAPFSKLQALPKDAKPIKGWNDRDEAWLDVVRGIRRVIEALNPDHQNVVSGAPPGPWRNLQKVTQQILASAQSTEALDDVGKQLALSILAAGGVLPEQTRDQARRRLEDEQRRHGQTGAPRAQDDYLDEVMHRINFTRLQDFLSYGEQHYTSDGFAALCVVQQSELMGGRWGLKRIHSWLKTEAKQPKEIHIQPVHNETFDAAMIIRRLAGAFGVEAGAMSGASAITQRICGTFHQDRRILITVQPCDEFSDDTWRWVLHEFWRSLLQEFRQGQTRRRVRLLMILLTDSILASDSVVAHCCDTTGAAFDQAKLARLPLDHWTEEELYDWLVEYWPVTRQDQELKALAQKIFSGSNKGQPLLIYNLCKKWLLREAG